MNISEEIYLNTGNTSNDKYLKIRLENNVDTFEILTLKIDTKDAYRDFNADYGVLVGRVIANDGIGIPNAKISIFIPLSDDDENDGDVKSIYPYKTPRDKNVEGKRYNLLPRVSQIDPNTGEIKPSQPFGSFPIKPEIVTNPNFLKVYKKYYKYTAVTNDFGDYMIYGVPIGTQTAHLSVDITDIGKYSMTPASMVTNLGYSSNFFTDNNSKIKSSSDLDDLPHIETQEISVDIIPFWGDSENFDIGITRQDFRIRAKVTNTFTIFGSVFTDGDNSMWGSNSQSARAVSELYYISGISDDEEISNNLKDYNVSISSKRFGKVTEKIYYYPNTVSDEEISNANDDVTDKMLLLDPSEYSIYKKNGDFVFIINCNRRKVITGPTGDEVVVPNNNESGVFTEFKGFVTLEIEEEEASMDFSDEIGRNTTVIPLRYKLKFPQEAQLGEGFSKDTSNYNKNWRKSYKTFEASKFYSFSRFHSTTYNLKTESDYNNFNNYPENLKLFKKDILNNPYLKKMYSIVGAIITDNFIEDDEDEENNPIEVIVINNEDFEFPSNTRVRHDNDSAQIHNTFGSNWLNLSIYLPQVGYLLEGYEGVREVRTNSNFHGSIMDNTEFNEHFVLDNDDTIAGNYSNTKFFARSDIHWTKIIEVPISDIITMKSVSSKGFVADFDNNNRINDTNYTLIGSDYLHGKKISPSAWTSDLGIVSCGKVNGDVNNSTYDSNIYFYKGIKESNVIQYLFDLGIIKTK